MVCVISLSLTTDTWLSRTRGRMVGIPRSKNRLKKLRAGTVESKLWNISGTVFILDKNNPASQAKRNQESLFFKDLFLVFHCRCRSHRGWERSRIRGAGPGLLNPGVKVTPDSPDVECSAREYLMLEYSAVIGMNCAKQLRPDGNDTATE